MFATRRSIAHVQAHAENDDADAPLSVVRKCLVILPRGIIRAYDGVGSNSFVLFQKSLWFRSFASLAFDNRDAASREGLLRTTVNHQVIHSVARLSFSGGVLSMRSWILWSVSRAERGNDGHRDHDVCGGLVSAATPTRGTPRKVETTGDSARRVTPPYAENWAFWSMTARAVTT